MRCMAATSLPRLAGTGFTPTWTVGDRLRKAREGAGIKVADMADRLGRERNTITRWERATHAQMMVIRLYALETGVSASWLAGNDPDAPEGGEPVTEAVTVWEPARLLLLSHAA